MKNLSYIVAIIVSLIVGGGVVYMWQTPAEQVEPVTEPVKMEMAEHTHESGPIEVPADAVPTVNIVAKADPKSGYNVQVNTTNFKFSPERASSGHIDGEGHAHIYVDGVKINRMYGNWYHLADLDPGRREIRVTLNSNNHSDLVRNGEKLEDVVIVEVPKLGELDGMESMDKMEGMEMKEDMKAMDAMEVN